MQTLYELDSLSGAKKYQKWIYESVHPYMGKRILEIGSGIGNLSQWLPQRELLVLSDVESGFVKHLSQIDLLKNPKVKTLQLDLSRPIFDQVTQYDLDTIVSFNVMEHVDDDFQAICDHVNVLKQSKNTGPKRIVIFVPPFQIAYGELDREFKHYRAIMPAI